MTATPKRPRGVCRLESIEGRGATKLHHYFVTCGCCGRSSMWTLGGSVRAEGHRQNLQWVQDAAAKIGWIFTGRLGWVCPREKCQSRRVLAEWRHAKGRSWWMRQRGGWTDE